MRHARDLYREFIFSHSWSFKRNRERDAQVKNLPTDRRTTAGNCWEHCHHQGYQRPLRASATCAPLRAPLRDHWCPQVGPAPSTCLLYVRPLGEQRSFVASMACQPPALTKTVSEQEAARWGIPSASARRMIDAGALQPQPEERSPSEQQAVLLIDGGATAGGGINESSPQTIDCPPPASPSTPRSPRASSRSRGLFCSLFACGVDEPPRPRDLGVPPPPPPRPPPPTPRPNESSSQAVSPAAAPRAPSPAAIAHTRVLWDIENVGCPRGESLDGLGVVTRLTEWLRAREPPLWGTGIDGCVTVFFCRGKSTVSAELERQLDKAAVEQVLVSDKREDADRKIVARLERDADNLLARDGGGGCAFVFITSDQDFRHQFQTGSRKGARVVVLHRAPSGSAHERALALHADEV